MKICTKCERELPATKEFFHLDKHHKRGLRPDCKECRKEYYWQKRNRILKQQKEYYTENKKDISKRHKEYFQTKKGKVTQKKADEKRYKKSKLSRCMSNMVWGCLKRNKANQHWEIFVSYTLKELILHLQGTIGLTTKICLLEFWQYFHGKYYHVDHIIPRSFFGKKLEDPNSKEFQTCWALENLQLLSAEENGRKGSSLTWTRRE